MQSLRRCVLCAASGKLDNGILLPRNYISIVYQSLTCAQYHSANTSNNSKYLSIRHSLSGNLLGQLLNPVAHTPLAWCQEQRRHKGHSKWQNIKHVKGLKDEMKQKIINKTMAKIRNAVREGGSRDPKLNHLLARAMDEAKQQDVPMATILAFFKRLENPKTAGSDFYIEAKGVSNSFLILECFAESQSKARNSTQSILKKFGGQIGDRGFASHSFEQKGVLVVAPTGEPLTLDMAEEVAIEVGAEEVEEVTDDDGQTNIRFVCDKKETNAVKKALIGLNHEVKESGIEYVPHTFVELSDQELELAAQMISMLEGLEHCVKVYDNLQ